MKASLAAFLLFLLLVGCAQQNQPAVSPDKGFSLSPRSTAEYADFFEQAKLAGPLITWAGDWGEVTVESGAPGVVAELCGSYDEEPLIEPQFFIQATGALIRPLTAAVKQSYRDGIVAFVKKYHPRYLGLGIEVNVLYEKSPADFDDFAAFYDWVYDAVKAESPGTKVFTIFQLEKMKGLNGGLFGGTNDPANNEWSLLDKFPKNDLAVFTTYPGLIYKSPAEIPADYYSSIKEHTGKTIAFSEIGWPSAATPEGWESSESEQADFVKTFLGQVEGLAPAFLVWSFMYDQATVVPFDSMGLRRSSDGAAKAAWSEWLND